MLFVGDATYDSPAGVTTMERALPLWSNALLELDTAQVVEGHNETVPSRTEFEDWVLKVARPRCRGWAPTRRRLLPLLVMTPTRTRATSCARSPPAWTR